MFDKMKRQLRADRSFLAKLLFIAAFPLVAYLHLSLYDPRDFTSYNGPVPVPLYLEVGDAGQETRGPEVMTALPGQKVTWPTDLCVEHGVVATGHLEFALDGGGPTLISRTRPIPIERCGQVWNTLTIPADTPDGDYEIRRWVSVSGLQTRQTIIKNLPEVLGHFLEVDRALPKMQIHIGAQPKHP